MIEEQRIQLRLTVVDPSRAGARADVEVGAPPGTPLAAIRAGLLAAVGHPGGGPASRGELYVDGVPSGGQVLGLPPLLDGAIVTVGRPGGGPGRRAGTCGGLAEVHVIAGPDAGGRHPLGPEATLLGRGPGTGLRIEDPDVSRAHAEIVASGAVVRVRDLGSTNGTVLDGQPVGHCPVPWPSGTVLSVGTSLLTLRSQDGDPASGGGPAATVPDGASRLLVNPAPRLPPPPVAGTVTFPDAPPEHTRTRLPWVAVVLPLVLSVPLAWWLHQPLFLAFALLSPLMMIGQYLSDRRDRRGEQSRALERHREGVEAAQAELGGLLAAERSRLLTDHPDPAVTAAVAAGPLQRLWERRDPDGDAAVLRVGLGTRRSRLDVRGSPPPGADPPMIADAPITIDLAGRAVGGVAGVAGPRREVLALARSLIGQAVVARSPQQLRVVVLTPDGDPAGDWDWAAWLPHASAELPPAPGRSSRDGAAGTEGRDDGTGPAGDPRILLVLDGAERLRRDPLVAPLLASPGGRLLALCLDGDLARLPAECGATIRVGPAGAEPGAVLAVRGEMAQPLRPDLVSARWAERLARDLARLADATPAAADRGLPASVHLLDLVSPGGTPSSRGIAAGWARCRSARARATTAVVGVTATGPWSLDLARHGPHALIAGTTGAGKSELLTTLVAALALAHPPDRITMLLVDYKGGTAFGPLANLPHTAGVLTDLDEHLARRALSSLRAELRRRERLLREAGAADVDTYEQARPPGAPCLPRLLIVVDEFRVLSEELPDLLAGLVRVAVVGRSLGVHLVLATQRPAGVVTAEIRANVNLRIALRVRDRMDSEDVVEAPDAALLPAGRPGRGLIRSGGEPLAEFQAARATGRRPRRAGPAEVRAIRRDGRIATAWQTLPPTGPEPHPGAPAPGPAASAPGALDDLAAIVAACRDATLLDPASGQARAPWLPPLPAVIRPGEVAGLFPDGAPDGGGPDASALTFGVSDLPQAQSRGPLRWDVRGEGHLAIIGAPGSGRTAAVRALIGAACRAGPAVHVHILDGGGRFAGLPGIARVGTVVPVTDTELAGRLLSRLAERSRGPAGGTAADRPLAVLAVDGWEQLLDAWLPFEHGRLVDELVRLTRDGTSAGLRLAVTGGRSLLSGPIAGLLTERLLLRAADPADLVLAGVPPGALPARMPPGRAVRVLPGGEVVEAQIVLDDPAAAPPPPSGGDPPERAPLRLAALAGYVTTTSLLAAQAASGGDARAMLDDGVLPLGLGGDDGTPLGPPADGTGWLVTGPPGSGRSTALQAAAEVLRAAGRAVVIVAGGRSPLARAGEATVASRAVRENPAHLLAALDRHAGATLIVDDLAELAGSVAEEEVLARLDAESASARWPAGPGPHVIAASTPADVVLAFRGLAARLRATRAGLLLAPTAPGDGDAFGVRVPVRLEGPPGRAVVIVAGRTQVIQVAAPATGPGAPAARV